MESNLIFYALIPIQMRLVILFIFTLLLECKFGVELPGYSPLALVSTLPAPLNESSGLARADDSTLFTHNDSGNPPVIYQISGGTGRITGKFNIPGVTNKDWEELAADSGFIYIGDIGNNAGTRKDLVIYKINKSFFYGNPTTPVGSIRYLYPEQTYFGPGRHNFDCEAMIAWGDSLYLFTKNRKDRMTDVYRLPKSPGDYRALLVGHFDTGGLITAADFRPGENNQLALLGYVSNGSRLKSFLWVFRGFQQTDFFGGKATRTELANDLQAEAILFTSDTTLLITNEEESGTTGKLYKLNLGK